MEFKTMRVPLTFPDRCFSKGCGEAAHHWGWLPATVSPETLQTPNTAALGDLLAMRVRVMDAVIRNMKLERVGDLYLYMPFASCSEHRPPRESEGA